MGFNSSAWAHADFPKGLGGDRLINGNFDINQEVVSGSVVLAAGVYGHDMFKAGAGGCSYTFATSAGITTLTISAGSLQQVIEGVNLRTDTYVLSWGGTAQGKIGAGSYSDSGVTSAVTGGSNLTIEFNTGTLFQTKFELGDVVNDFVPKLISDVLMDCQRYYYIEKNTLDTRERLITYSRLTTTLNGTYVLPTNMRVAPTVSISGTVTARGANSNTNITAGLVINATVTNNNSNQIKIAMNLSVALTQNETYHIVISTGGSLAFDARI